MSTPLLSSNTAHTVGAAAVNIANEARFSFLKNFREQRLSNLKPLGEFFDRNRFNLTSSFPEITKRWK
jgi:hypothetical protein